MLIVTRPISVVIYHEDFSPIYYVTEVAMSGHVTN